MTTSILILTHNAPRYVEETLVTLNEVTDPQMRAQFEVVVLDNASDEPTKKLLDDLKGRGYIDKLQYSDENTFFARGNNLAAEMADQSSEYYLLFNSDVRIKRADWLSKLIELQRSMDLGAVSFGYCEKPSRGDGYCLLVKSDLYRRFKLDEDFPWWGSATKLQYEVLCEGHNIIAIDDHDDYIYHYGGKSGRDYRRTGKLDQRYYDMIDRFEATPGKVIVGDMNRQSGRMSGFRRKMKKVVNLIKRKL